MKKIIVIVVGAIVLGAAYWLGSPLFFDKKVNEELIPVNLSIMSSPENPVVLSEGKFVDADSFHKGEGTAKLLKHGDKYFVRFESDFKTTNGPDLFVYFGRNGAYVKEARIERLKGNIGAQNYEVPEGIDPLQYNEVWIWCRAFSVPFAHAVLK